MSNFTWVANFCEKNYSNELGYTGVLNNYKIFITDCTNDELDDIVVGYTTCINGGTACETNVVFFYNNNGNIELSNYLKETGVLKSVSNNTVYCIKYEYAVTDPNCCPSIEKNISYNIIKSGSSFKIIN